jgi:hypothetical protein
MQTKHDKYVSMPVRLTIKGLVYTASMQKECRRMSAYWATVREIKYLMPKRERVSL